MFIGRQEDLKELRALTAKRHASLVVIHGRRRIGKSSLLAEYGKSFEHYHEFQGLGPREHQSDQDQLDNFAKQLQIEFRLPGFKFSDWTDAFQALAELSAHGQRLIVLDEISWMGAHDADFAGKLKIAWDTKFKKNPKLVVALCGSVSSWIEKNILQDTDFVGRISYAQNLGPLTLKDCNEFWGKSKARVTSKEKLELLCVTGCVPKYLEEMIPSESALANITRLCFSKSGYLFLDFEKIFNDIFNRRASTYKNILRHLLAARHDAKTLATLLKISQSGDLTEYLEDMRAAGFVARDFAWDFSGKRSKLSRYRIRDNYLRFYLKYVEPRKEAIEKGIFKCASLDALVHWQTIRGLQFENLILDNIPTIIEHLSIDPKHLQQYGSYFQTKTKKRQGCQIDLLIQDRFQTLHVCEVKFQKRINTAVIAEIEYKIKSLELPKNYTVRPILLYAGELDDEVRDRGFFDKILDVGTVLSG